MIETDTVHRTAIQRFFAKKNVFITGSTGFLGKTLIEKLLRSCPEINAIYVLVRNKKGKSLYQRIEDMLEDVVFDKLKEDCPKYRHKVVGISGDIGEPNLGINAQDRQLLIKEVNVIFHVAATVRFDEKLSMAVNLNVKGVREMLKLANEITNLKSFLHVSTLYTQCVHNLIEERFYEPPMDYKKLIELVETSDDAFLADITPSLLGDYPNTYSFTKAVAEGAIKQEAGNLPIAIFRPAIVISSYKEPLHGWIDNLYGPTGVTAAASNGLLRCLRADKKANANLVPVDMCVNGLICAAWETSHTAKTRTSPEEIPIYQYESSTDSPINWEEYMGRTEDCAWDYPSINAIWYYSLVLIKSQFWYNVAFFLLHTFPAFIVDGITICIGKKPRLLKIYSKVKKFSDVIAYFATREWQVKSYNVGHMINTMSAEDQELFFCDLKRLDWKDYFVDYFKGIRIYLVKDPLTTLPQALIKMKRLYWAHQILKVVIVYLLLRLFWFWIKLFL